ncbi:hypothetical protein WH47_05950 [Habropoda laboriosa]|uniref:Histone-lysine N-methyltransferase SETMAR n=1 Tax=Habropoda laboriosa TaxID=597456 RepID=A0A0L7RE87_9HYME|nr:hypothetical protein WH47_05949 [Habropoda laboriosa]KOC69287.1 hypothetical protein WH47_05950 [Habropoda laboriosa]
MRLRRIVSHYYCKGKSIVQSRKKCRSGRLMKVDNDRIQALAENDPHKTTREIAEINIENYLHNLGCISRSGAAQVENTRRHFGQSNSLEFR